MIRMIHAAKYLFEGRYDQLTFAYDFECMLDVATGEHSPNCLDLVCLEDPTITSTIYGPDCHIKFLE